MNSPGPPGGLRILLAEDDAGIQLLAARILERDGHRIAVVRDGLGVVPALEEGRFDVVLMDIEMPRMDGLEATQAVRDYEDRVAKGLAQPPAGSSFVPTDPASRIPVIALTGYPSGEFQQACERVGMDGYVDKPIRWDQLRALLRRFRGIPGVEQEAPEIRTGSRASIAAPFELDVALRAVGGNVELLEKFMHIFLMESPWHIRAMREAIRAHDLRRARAAMRRLRSLLGTLGDSGALRAIVEMEGRMRSASTEGISSLIVEFEAELLGIRRFLEDDAWKRAA